MPRDARPLGSIPIGSLTPVTNPQSASFALSTRHLKNNFQFVCPLSHAKPLSLVKAVNNAADLRGNRYEI
jgi:hypothetical protein